MIALQTERVRKIVKGLLDFSRQTRPELEPVELDHLPKGVSGLWRTRPWSRG
jgi:phosphoglycerate-specific signal transduction histidine kinase